MESSRCAIVGQNVSLFPCDVRLPPSGTIPAADPRASPSLSIRSCPSVCPTRPPSPPPQPLLQSQWVEACPRLVHTVSKSYLVLSLFSRALVPVVPPRFPFSFILPPTTVAFVPLLPRSVAPFSYLHFSYSGTKCGRPRSRKKVIRVPRYTVSLHILYSTLVSNISKYNASYLSNVWTMKKK